MLYASAWPYEDCYDLVGYIAISVISCDGCKLQSQHLHPFFHCTHQIHLPPAAASEFEVQIRWCKCSDLHPTLQFLQMQRRSANGRLGAYPTECTPLGGSTTNLLNSHLKTLFPLLPGMGKPSCVMLEPVRTHTHISDLADLF